MSPATAHLSPALLAPSGALNQRLRQLHERILQSVPCVDRIACAIYDAGKDVLKTFINSTRSTPAPAGYEFRLSDSSSLHQLAQEGRWRVIDDLPAVIPPDNLHARWVLERGYRSSFTVPLFDRGAFGGFVFFNSHQLAAFTPLVQRDLALYSSRINSMLVTEFFAVRQAVAAVRMAQDFAHLRDFETGAHLERMAQISRLIAQDVAPQHGLDEAFVDQVCLFAPLHDIGKIGVPDQILLKPGRLDAAEREVMQSHVTKGGAMIDRLIEDFGLQHLPHAAMMRHIVGLHHELLDGTGYPHGLCGAQIPLAARIVTVADIFDALTSPRPYKRAWGVDEACSELERMAAAGKLDAGCVAALRRQGEALADILQRYQDEPAA